MNNQDYIKELRRIQNMTDEEISFSKRKRKAQEIVEIFEEYIELKGIEIDNKEGNNLEMMLVNYTVLNTVSWLIR